MRERNARNSYRRIVVINVGPFTISRKVLFRSARRYVATFIFAYHDWVGSSRFLNSKSIRQKTENASPLKERTLKVSEHGISQFYHLSPYYVRYTVET